MRKNKSGKTSGSNKLLFEISASFFGLVLFIVVIMAVIIGVSIRTTYGRFVRQNDRLTARHLAETFNESPSDFAGFFGSIKNTPPMFDMAPGKHLRDNMRDKRMFPLRRRPVPKRMIVIDRKGRVLFDSHPENPLPDLKLSEGFEVKAADGTAGLLFAGTMIDPRLGENDRMLIVKINRAILISLGAGLLSALLLAWFLAGRITKPIAVVSHAAGSIADGQLETRVQIRRNNELGDLADSFNSMAESLQHMIQVQKDLIADTAHELRTPVSLIQNRLELMLDGVYKINRTEIEHVYRDSMQLSKLIEDLQKLYSAETDQAFYNFQDADLKQLLASAVNSLSVKARDKNVAIDLACQGVIPLLVLDPARMIQVFHNLLINALEWTPENSTVSVSCSADERNVMIDVRDEGPGISPEHRQRIFDRLYRVDPSRNRSSGGSGIGLAVCRQIISRHNGKIEVLDSPVGALFRITLPAT